MAVETLPLGIPHTGDSFRTRPSPCIDISSWNMHLRTHIPESLPLNERMILGSVRAASTGDASRVQPSRRPQVPTRRNTMLCNSAYVKLTQRDCRRGSPMQLF